MQKYTTERFNEIKTQQILCHDKIIWEELFQINNM